MPLEGEFEAREIGAGDVLRAFRRFVLGIVGGSLRGSADAIPVRTALGRLVARVSALAPLLRPDGVVELEIILSEAKQLLLVNVASEDEPLSAAVERTLEEALARVSAMATRRNLHLAGAGRMLPRSQDGDAWTRRRGLGTAAAGVRIAA